MRKNMPIGIEDFKELYDSYYFIDKTNFIQELLDKPSKVTLITRPRRFGKTLTMSMLDYFFSIDKKEQSQHIFTNLRIGKTSYIEQQHTYPVVFLTLKGLSNSTWTEMYQSFIFLIRKEYDKHPYLWNAPTLTAMDKEYGQRILNGTASIVEYQMSLVQLTEFLYRYFGVKPIILIDEYDAPIHTAYEKGFYDTALSFFKLWYTATLKGNEFLHFAVLTGVLRVAKESIFSGLNNLTVSSVLSEQYSTIFGFTIEDIQHLLKDLQQEDKLQEIQYWYDGYRFGTTDIYNPWSVISYIYHNCTPKPYWVSTSENGILQSLLRHADGFRMKELQTLLDGQTIRMTLNENFTFKQIDQDDSMLYTMLLTTGYVTAVASSPTTYNRYALRIPNEEIRQVYTAEILNTLATGINQNTFDNLFDELQAGNAENFEYNLQRILAYFVISYDAANKESFYHGFMLGLTSLFLGKQYSIESNRESGYGRFDVACFPRNPKGTGIIMEFKVAATPDTLEEKAQEALQQITQKNYLAEFEKRGIAHVWQYGIAFSGKHVKIVRNS